MEVSVEHLGAVQFEIRARQHVIACDQPVESGGFDEGMTPPELLLASLASCVGYYAAQYLRKHKLADAGTRVRVTAGKRKENGMVRLDDFQVSVEVPATLDARHAAGIEREIGHCLIHNTLLQPPKIAVAVQSAAPVSA